MIRIIVDTAVEVFVNLAPLISSADFVTIDEGIAYNESGMDLNWNFQTPAGVVTQTNVVPTTGGVYDWTHVGNGMYKIEIPDSGGGSINNDREGSGFFSGVCDAILPWVSPTYEFVPANVANSLVIGSDYLQVDTTQIEGGDATDALSTAATASLNSYDPPTYDEVEGFVQLMTRSDAAIETDRAALLTAINANEGSGAGDYSAQTDAQEALRDWIGNGTNLTEAGGTGDHLTAIDLPNQTMDITGNITGNLSGSVGSVTGAVGSVTGNVGGNVAGSVGSVTGAVGSVTGNVGGNVAGSVASVTGNVGGNVVGSVASVTGNVGGNIVGSVANVTGGINTGAGVLTTLDALDTAQDAQHATTQADIAALNDLSAAQVNAEVDTALADYDGPTYDELLAFVQLLAREDLAIAADRAAELAAINANEGSGAGAYDNNTDALEAGFNNAITNGDVLNQVRTAWATDTHAQPGQATPPATTTYAVMLEYLYKAWRNRHTQTATEYNLYNDDAVTVDQQAATSDDTVTYERGEIVTGP